MKKQNSLFQSSNMSPTSRRAKQFVLSRFKDDWFTAARNPDELVEFKGEGFDFNDEHERETLVKHLAYITELHKSIRFGSDFISDEVQKEMMHYETRGGVCLFVSVLLHRLLLDAGFSSKDLRYYQGKYFFEPRQDNPLAVAMGKVHASLHGWLTYKGSVVDVAISQEEYFFDFGDSEPIILGELPAGMTYLGYMEPAKILNKYVESFAKYRKMSVDDWLSVHKEQVEVYYKHAKGEIEE